MHIKLPVLQISERFDDAASDMADDDQMMLPSFRLTLQDCTFRRAESVMIVKSNRMRLRTFYWVYMKNPKTAQDQGLFIWMVKNL